MHDRANLRNRDPVDTSTSYFAPDLYARPGL